MAQRGAVEVAKRLPSSLKPILSKDFNTARRRLLGLYRAWYREMPQTVTDYGLSISIREARRLLRLRFDAYMKVEDIRILDMLVVKGTQELEETHKLFKQETHILHYLNAGAKKPDTDFVTRFYKGKD